MNMQSVTTKRAASDLGLHQRENRPPPLQWSAATIAALLIGFSATGVSAQPEIRILYHEEVISAADVFDLGAVALYQEEHVQFAVHNFGDASLELIGTPRVEIAELSDGDEADFRVALDTPEVAPGGLALLDLWFTPSSRSDREIEITVRSNDEQARSYSITLRASGVAPLINVSTEQVTIEDGDAIDIGEVRIGQLLEVELLIENLGNAPLMLTGDPEHIEIDEHSDGSSEDFEIILQAALIAPGASAPLIIVLDPASPGQRVVDMVIPSSDPDHAQYAIRLEALVHEESQREPDCNGNLIADSIEIISLESEDCDRNGVPDECQADSDSDGIIDACEEGAGDDPDGDGQDDPDGDGGSQDGPGDGIGDGGSGDNQDPPQGQDGPSDESPGGGVDEPQGGGSNNRQIFNFCGSGGLGMLPCMMLGLAGMRYRRGR